MHELYHDARIISRCTNSWTSSFNNTQNAVASKNIVTVNNTQNAVASKNIVTVNNTQNAVASKNIVTVNNTQNAVASKNIVTVKANLLFLQSCWQLKELRIVTVTVTSNGRSSQMANKIMSNVGASRCPSYR